MKSALFHVNVSVEQAKPLSKFRCDNRLSENSSYESWAVVVRTDMRKCQ